MSSKVLNLITQDSRATASECQLKSALQIWLLAFIYQSSSEPVGPLWLSSVISSILLFLGNQVCCCLKQNKYLHYLIHQHKNRQIFRVTTPSSHRDRSSISATRLVTTYYDTYL